MRKLSNIPATIVREGDARASTAGVSTTTAGSLSPELSRRRRARARGVCERRRGGVYTRKKASSRKCFVSASESTVGVNSDGAWTDADDVLGGRGWPQPQLFRPCLVTDQLLYHGKDISFAPYGEYWRQVRKISVLHILSPKRVQSFQSVREEEVRLTINNIAKSSGLINIGEIMISTTNNIISRVAFGKKYYEEKGRATGFPKMLAEFLLLLGTVHIGDVFPSLAWVGELTGLNARLKKNFQEWDEFLEKVIEEHLDPCRTVGDGYKQDFVDILLDIEKSGEIGFPLGKDGLKALILDNFAAGTDTIYTALVWLMTELVRHPRVLNKVQAEIREATHGRDQVLEDDIEHMLYMKSVVKEAMRLHPPIPLLVPRQSTQDVELNGYHIPARTRVVINAWAIGMDPKSWEAPDQFWPERFMDSTSKSNSIDLRGHDFQLIPFGAGRRGCPAVSYAIVEIEYVLASLLQRFDWELPEGITIEDVDMTETLGMTAHKKFPLLLIAKDRFQH